MSREGLINFIEEAFNGVKQPEKVTLHVAEAHDCYDYDNDELHRQKDFIGPWQDLPSSHIRECQTALSHLDKTGMRFYLPAYMVWYLKNFGNNYEITSDHTLYILEHHPDYLDLSEHHGEKFSLFTPKQLKACALFVKFCAEDSTEFTDTFFAREQYEKYWKKYNIK